MGDFKISIFVEASKQADDNDCAILVTVYATVKE